MRMYTLHFGHGLEHTEMFSDYAHQNLPSNYSTGWASGTGYAGGASSFFGHNNTQIVSHREILERYGVKGGHGEYCLEVWQHEDHVNACNLFTGGWGDLPFTGHADDVRPFYLKFDFMYTNTTGGGVLVLQRSRTGSTSRDLSLSLSNGYLNVVGCKHITQPDSDPPSYLPTAWMQRSEGRQGFIYLEPDKWHEIQVFVNPQTGWGVSEIGPPPIMGYGYEDVDVLQTMFEAYEIAPTNPPTIPDAEAWGGAGLHDLQMDPWPNNGHPIFPNAMLPGQDQTAWPPENYASGQYFYGEDLGLVYVWVNGKLDIEHSTHMANEQSALGWSMGYTQQKMYLGFDINNSDPDDSRGGRFFYDNIIWNDSRDPSGTVLSKIFDPLFSSHESLEWNPGYGLKFTAMEMDPDHLENEWDRTHDGWLPDYPLGALVPSGDPYFVPAPNRYGAPTDSMIPHGTKLTPINVDWDGEQQEYTVEHGNEAWHDDYGLATQTFRSRDFAYQHIQPNESNPWSVSSDAPMLESEVSGSRSLFYLKRPLSVSGEQPLAGGYGLGGVKDYVPNINADMGETALPPIYRIWTCLQDFSTGTNKPCDTQHHLIRVPSGISGYVDYISDGQCPGDRTFRAWHDGNSATSDGSSLSDWPYNPVTGDPWTWDDLDEIQIGVSHEIHTGGNSVAIRSIFLVVEHGTAIDPEIGILGNNLLVWEKADDIPFYMQSKEMYHPGWRYYEPGENFTYYNRWGVSPVFTIDRTDGQTADGEAIISGPQYSGTIELDYSIRYLNGEIVTGPQYRKFDEHFPEVWVYTISGYSPSNPIRHPMRGEVITDCNGDHFTFLTYPVLQYNDKKYPTDQGLSPLNRYPYIVYDYQTLYVIPLHIHNVATLLDPEEMYRTWTDPNAKPSISGSLGTTWTINKSQNAFNFKVDPDSYFSTFSPSSVVNHASTHPGETIDYTFPVSRSGHDYYFQAPDLPSGSVFQIIHLTEKLGVPEAAIDHELYEANIGLYQTTANQTTNDTGEGRFDFYTGVPGSETFISGYTFGQDGTAGWHMNDVTVLVPSGTRQVQFTFSAIRNTTGPKSPGGTLGGTSNFASFDEPFFILSMSSGHTPNAHHPADTDQDGRIGSEELANYIMLWQSGMLPLGVAKDYLTKAESIWQSGTSTYFGDPSGGLYYDAADGPKPDRWMSSGLL